MRNKRLGTIIQYLLIAILVFVLYNIFLIFGADKSDGKATSFFGYRLFVITSDSMAPTFNENDMIFVKTTNDYEIGDIITYKIDNTDIPITHRIIEKYDDNSFLTQGDNNSFADPSPVSKDKIIGEMVYSIPNIGLGIEITQKLRYILLILIVFLIWRFIYKKKKEKSKRRKIKKEIADNEEEDNN